MAIDKKIKDHNFGEFWERCVSVTELWDKKNSNTLFVINTHLGIGAGHRLEACQMIDNLAAELLDKEVLSLLDECAFSLPKKAFWQPPGHVQLATGWRDTFPDPPTFY